MNRRATAGFVYLIGVLAVAGILALGGRLAATAAGGLALQAGDTTPWAVGANEAAQPDASTVDVSQPAGTPSPSGNLIGGNFAICRATDNQMSAEVAWNGTTHEYLVVWKDRRNGSYYQIYGRRVGSNGALLGDEFAISTTAFDHEWPALAWNATSNEYLVVWQELRSSSSWDIYSQRVGATGVLMGSSFAISTRQLGQWYPVAAWNGTTNEYLLAWSDRRTGEGDIYGQRVEGSNGTLLGSDFDINGAQSYPQAPAVSWNETANEYLVVWTSRQVDGSWNIYGQRVTERGTLTGADFAIAADVSSPALAWNSTANEYLVIWLDDRAYPYESIYGQRLAGNGTLLDSDFVISTATWEQSDPDVVWNGVTNEYLAVWSDHYHGTGLENPYIYGQRVRGTGALLGNNFAIATSWNSRGPSAVWNAAANEYLVVWQEGPSSSFLDIYGQRVAGIRPAQTFLPLVTHQEHPMPATPTLNLITPPGASPSYTVRWSVAPSATAYVLQRATNAGFADATQVYAGTGTSATLTSRGIARYYFRVKARNEWGESPWSDVQSVEVRWEQEPNYPLAQANGPLFSGLSYYGYPNDASDYFFFQAASRGQVTIDLTNHTGLGLQLVLRTSTGALVTQVNLPPYHLVTTVDPGRYYIQIFSTGGFNTTIPYTLRGVFP